MPALASTPPRAKEPKDGGEGEIRFANFPVMKLQTNVAKRKVKPQKQKMNESDPRYLRPSGPAHFAPPQQIANKHVAADVAYKSDPEEEEEIWA